MTAVSLIPADPVSDGAVRQAGVGLLVASGKVGDLGAINHPLGHAVAWHRALPASTVAIATSCVAAVVATVDLGVVLVQHLCHVRHCGVGDFHIVVAVDDLSQLVAMRETGVNPEKYT